MVHGTYRYFKIHFYSLHIIMVGYGREMLKCGGTRGTGIQIKMFALYRLLTEKCQFTCSKLNPNLSDRIRNGTDILTSISDYMIWINITHCYKQAGHNLEVFYFTMVETWYTIAMSSFE